MERYELLSYVLDSSVIIKWLINEEGSETAQKFLLDYDNGKVQFLAPQFFYFEVCNALWVRRRDGFSRELVIELVKDLLAIDFCIISMEEYFEIAYDISFCHDVSFYDSSFLAVSQLNSCDFITSDEKLYCKLKTDFHEIRLLKEFS